MPDNYDSIIAERTWTYHVSPTERIPVPVRFTKPRRCETDGFWECRFLIYWPDGNVIERKGIGPDSVDALVTIITLFKIECEKLKAAIGDKITFESSSSLGWFGMIDLEETSEEKTAEPGATDNPDDAQRKREDH